MPLITQQNAHLTWHSLAEGQNPNSAKTRAKRYRADARNASMTAPRGGRSQRQDPRLDRAIVACPGYSGAAKVRAIERAPSGSRKGMPADGREPLLVLEVQVVRYVQAVTFDVDEIEGVLLALTPASPA